MFHSGGTSAFRAEPGPVCLLPASPPHFAVGVPQGPFLGGDAAWCFPMVPRLVDIFSLNDKNPLKM